MSCDESNCGDIYKFLEKENLSNDTENMLYLISAPIFLFKKINLDQEILNKIELIDFPGIDVDEEIISDIFKKIIQLSDTFIFVNECNLIKKTDNINIIQKIVGRIENRKFNFDYNSCLFILNKADKAENNNINKIQKKKEFEDILFGGKSKFGYIIDFFRAKKNKIKIRDYNENFYKLKCCLMESGITENEIKSKSETLDKIIQNYANIFGNYEKDQFYIDSRANSFLNGLKNKFIYAKDMTEKQYYQKIKQFINTLQIIFKLIQQKSQIKIIIGVNQFQEKMNKKLSEINSAYKESKSSLNKRIDSVFE